MLHYKQSGTSCVNDTNANNSGRAGILSGLDAIPEALLRKHKRCQRVTARITDFTDFDDIPSFPRFKCKRGRELVKALGNKTSLTKTAGAIFMLPDFYFYFLKLQS